MFFEKISKYADDNGIIILAQQYMDAIEIIYPPVLRKRFMELISYRTHKL